MTDIWIFRNVIKLIKDITISFFLITLTIVVIRISLKYSDIKSEVNDCQKIKFGNKATAIVCQQNVELTNNYLGKTQELATSIAQATAISALEYLYKNIAVFRPLLNEYRIFLNETHILFKDIELSIDFKLYESELKQFGSLLNG